MMTGKPVTSADRARTVAVAGKGGGGKTVTIAMMAKILRESSPRATKLLLIDADPTNGLLSAIGVKVKRTMGEVREDIIRTARGSDEEARANLADEIDYLVLQALTELDGFAVLAMGRSESLGCYCPVNALLRDAIQTLSGDFDVILIDGEAGLEQMSRQVIGEVDTLLVVSDPTQRGMQVASTIKKMVEVDKAITCGKLGLVLNRVRGSEQELRHSAAELGMDVFGVVPFDPNIAEYDLAGKPILDLPADSPSVAAYRDIVSRYVLS